MSPAQRLALIALGLHRLTRAELPAGHGTTQALAALLRRGLIQHDPVDDTYRRT